MSKETRLSSAALLAIAGLSGEINASEANSSSPKQQVYPAGSMPTFTGPEATFTGQVDVEVVFPGGPTSYSGAYVTFQPGARTAWHDHPAGQHMIVTKGTAITATRDGQVIEFSEGEAVWCPDDLDHWHGATPHSAMTHFVVTNSNEKGENVNWKDKVTGEQYQAALEALDTERPTLEALSDRYQKLTAVAAFAALDDLGSLKVAINEALDSGLPINEVKEALVHLYPYAGFPKALNALGTMMAVVEEREASGKKDEQGPAASELPDDALELGIKVQTELVGRPVSGPLFEFAPVANTFLQKHLFGDVFARGLLNNQDREILTVAILSAMPGAAPQLKSHIFMAKNTGLTDKQLEQLGTWLSYRVTRSVGLAVENAMAE